MSALSASEVFDLEYRFGKVRKGLLGLAGLMSEADLHALDGEELGALLDLLAEEVGRLAEEVLPILHAAKRVAA